MTDNPNRILGDNSGNQVDTIDDGGVRRLAVDMKISGQAADQMSFLSAGRNANVTNVYLRGPGNVPTNVAGFILPFDATIIGIGASSNGAETWVAEVRKNNSATVIASLSLNATDKDSRSDLSVNVDADDEIQLYCNGTAINRPMILVALERR